MKTVAVAAIIESSRSGFGVYADQLPGITGIGDTIEEAKNDFFKAFNNELARYRHQGLQAPADYNDGDVFINFTYYTSAA